MIPNNKLTSTYVEGNWLFENSEEDLIDIQPGNIDLNINEESPTYQLWEMYYENNIIKLKSYLNDKLYNIKSISNITELSFSFTLNMSLTYLYVKNNEVYLNYYDTVSQQNKEDIFTNMAHPKLTYDDFRETQTNLSDILLVYINTQTNQLCYRMLRDRYTIEYVLSDVVKHTRLVRVGMADNFRLKFKLQGF